MSCRRSGQEQGDVLRGLSHSGRLTRAHHPQGSFAVVSLMFFMLYAFQVFVLSKSCGLQEEGFQASVPRPCRSLFVYFLSGSQEVPNLARTLR